MNISPQVFKGTRYGQLTYWNYLSNHRDYIYWAALSLSAVIPPNFLMFMDIIAWAGVPR